jgi:hypothetical protein
MGQRSSAQGRLRDTANVGEKELMNNLYDEFGKEIKSNRRERTHKRFWTSGAKIFGAAITILIALVPL